MKKTILALGAMSALIVGTASAAPYVESFAGLTISGTGSLAGTTALPNFSNFSNFVFGTPHPVIVEDAANAFPNGSDNFYFSHTSSGDVGYGIRLSAVLDNTAVIQAAVALNVTSLDANPANNYAWLLRLDGNTGGAVTVGIRVENGDMILESDGGWTQQTISTEFFKQGANTWEGAGWKVLAVRAVLDDAGAGSIKIWEINTTNGSATELLSQDNVTTAAPTGVGAVWLAAWDTAVFPAAAYANVTVLTDEISIYQTTDVADEAAFLTTVGADYSDSAANVSDWSMF